MFYIISKRKINNRRKYLKKHEHDAEDETEEIERLRKLYPEDSHLQNLKTE